MTRYVIRHPMPTGAEMRAEINRKIDAGEPLGASHVSEIKGDVFANGSIVKPHDYSKITHRKLKPSSALRWNKCRGHNE